MGSKLWSCFSRTIFQTLPKETTKYLCCFISQYSTYSVLQNDNFIRITSVGRLLSGRWQYSHANKSQHRNCEGGCQTKVFLSQYNLNTDLLVFIKLKFLRILNSSQSFQEQVMTCSSYNYTIWDRKNWIQLYLNLFQYLPLHSISFDSLQVTRWGEHMHLVRSGGARNYFRGRNFGEF